MRRTCWRPRDRSRHRPPPGRFSVRIFAALGADTGRLAARVGFILRRLRLAAGALGGTGLRLPPGRGVSCSGRTRAVAGVRARRIRGGALGRRPTLVAFLLLSASGCFAFGVGSSVGLLATATLLMSFALLGTWGALYAFTPELYPTELRATGMGSAGAMARLGGLLAPTVLAPVIASGLALRSVHLPRCSCSPPFSR